MINLRITGLYNRGQQDEYVELEAAAAEYALKENRAGRCIPNSQVESFIKAKRGWK